MSIENKQNMYHLIADAQSILIPLPESRWQESLGTALALSYVLKALKKQVFVVTPLGAKFQYVDFLSTEGVTDFLDGLHQSIISIDIHKYPISELKYEKTDSHLNIFLTPELSNVSKDEIEVRKGRYQYDLIITLNTPHWEYLGEIFHQNADLFYDTPSISIDTSVNHAQYARVNWVDSGMSNTAEMVYQFLKELYPEFMTADIATGLLLGMISETQNFQTPTTGPRTFMAAAELMDQGGDRENIIRVLYKSKQLRILKLMGRIMAHLDFLAISTQGHTQKLAFSKLYNHDFSKTETNREDIHEVIRELQEHFTPDVRALHIMFETGSKVKEGVIRLEGELGKLKGVLDGEVHRGLFQYSYPTEGDVHTACDEVNELIKKVW